MGAENCPDIYTEVSHLRSERKSRYEQVIISDILHRILQLSYTKKQVMAMEWNTT